MPFTVLIVDDSKLARIVAAKALARLRPDWQKIEAGSAAEALDLIDREGADMALIDYNMTEKDGLELAAELSVLKPDMPIAIITANIQDEIITRAREIGAVFVAKPVTTDTLGPFLDGAALRAKSRRA